MLGHDTTEGRGRATPPRVRARLVRVRSILPCGAHVARLGTARAPHRCLGCGRPLCALETPEPATGRRLPSCRATRARVCTHPDTPRPALARPSLLGDLARAWPHAATAYGGAGQAHPAVGSAPTRSQRSPAARWRRMVHAPLLPPRRAAQGHTGSPDWGQEHGAARSCAVLPMAGGTTSARGRHATSRMTGSRASWCRSWTAPAWSRSARGAAQSWKSDGGQPQRVVPWFGVWRGSQVVAPWA